MLCVEYTCEGRATDHEYGEPACTYQVCLEHEEVVVHAKSEQCPEPHQ